MSLTLQQRAECYSDTFPERPPLQLVKEGIGRERHDVVYGLIDECEFGPVDDGLEYDELRGVWVIGNNYRNKTKYYGAYPAGYIQRVSSLFPDVPAIDAKRGKLTTLHAFSGSLPEGAYVRCDIKQPAEISKPVEDLGLEIDGKYALSYADPPYSTQDAEHYGTPMVNRGSAMRGLANVIEVSGHAVWLDTVWPMHRKDQWRTVGRITLVRSTNHRVRMVSIFERVSL